MSKNIKTVLGPDSVIKTGTCTITKERYSVTVPRKSYERWQKGELIQRVFPSLSDDDREFLLSGTTPKEWDAMLEDGEDFPDDYEPSF
jgi:hypothetical protein